MRTRNTRVGAAAASAIAALTLAVAPAYAHFCSKSGWNQRAQTHAAGSEAWATAEEWLDFIGEAEAAGEICTAGADYLRDEIDRQPDDTLYKGPGILAGGQEFRSNDRSKGPQHFHYLNIREAFARCGGEPEH